MGGGLGSGSGSAIFLGGRGGMRLGFGFGLGRISWKRLLVSRFTSHSGSGSAGQRWERECSGSRSGSGSAQQLCMA